MEQIYAPVDFSSLLKPEVAPSFTPVDFSKLPLPQKAKTGAKGLVMSRRQFIKLTALGGVNLAIGTWLSQASASVSDITSPIPSPAPESFKPLSLEKKIPEKSERIFAHFQPKVAPIEAKAAVSLSPPSLPESFRPDLPALPRASLLPQLITNPTLLTNSEIQLSTGKPLIRNSVRLVETDDRSNIDFIGENFDDPAYGYVKDGKIFNYPPPTKLPDGTLEYTILDEKGPTLVYWMWFTNRHYQDRYQAMGNIRIYVDDKLAVNMPARDFFKGNALPQMQGFTWRFNETGATGSYYPIAGNKSLKIAFTQKPEWFDIRGLKLNQPVASSFTDATAKDELLAAKKIQDLRKNPETFIESTEGLERRRGINILSSKKGTIELNNLFSEGTTVNSFHLTVNSNDLQNLGSLNIYIDGKKNTSVPMADLFHLSFNQDSKLNDHKSLLAGVYKSDENTSELYFNIPFSFKQNVKFELENNNNRPVTIKSRFKTTQGYLPAALHILSQEGSTINFQGEGKLLRVDWDVTAPRKYQVGAEEESWEDEIFDQNPTIILDGYKETSTGSEDFTGHGFYWNIWSSKTNLPGGMVFTFADENHRRTRFYRQFLSNFEGNFSNSLTLQLPVPSEIKDKVKVRSTIIYYQFEKEKSLEPKSKEIKPDPHNLFFFGTHAGEFYRVNNPEGYPISVDANLIKKYYQAFSNANPQIAQAKDFIPMTFNVDPEFIHAGLLSELLIEAQQSRVEPVLIIKASPQEAMGIDEEAENRGKTLAEMVEEAMQLIKKVDKNYPPIKIAFTNEPNFVYAAPFWTPGWTGTGKPEGGGKAVYEGMLHFSKKCPSCELYMPALTVVGRNPDIMAAAETYAREFWTEASQKGIPKNFKGYLTNAFGVDPIVAMSDIPDSLDIWYKQANLAGFNPKDYQKSILITEIGPGDVSPEKGNESEETVPFLSQLAEITSQVRKGSGQWLQFIRGHNNPSVRKIEEVLKNSSAMTFFTWNATYGYNITLHPEIKIPD